ncbi:uncharacterized protein LOC101235984 [Hydra vulgaris]|uniref:uncharacterized protein LOC101235984 n=1 Tax=Hydra vulgaris TaxID=6087 RepID=UPI001F5E57CC|nr:uncharacterized protein LOC101235984 [Hydra vulgaris]
MLSSRNSVFKPSLDLITEELSLNSDNHIDKLVSEEYAVITNDDITNALDNKNTLISDSEDASISDFFKMHNRIKAKSFTPLNTELSSSPTSENSENSFNNIPPFKPKSSEINVDASLNEIISQSSENQESPSEQVFVSDFNPTVFSDLNGIAIDSNIGKKYFTKAIKGKYMNVYYSYTKEFILNRSDFYFQNLSMMLKILDCDLSLTGFEKSSQNLLELLFVMLLQLVVEVTQVHIFSSVESFRSEIKSCCRFKNSVMFCYSNINPCTVLIVIGYFKEHDCVLLLYDKQLVWVYLYQLWEMLQNKFDGTAGYIIMRRPESELIQTQIKLTISKDIYLVTDKRYLLDKYAASFVSAMDSWSLWLNHPLVNSDGSPTEIEKNVVCDGSLFLIQLVKEYATTHLDCSNHKSDFLLSSNKLLSIVMNTDIFRLIKFSTDIMSKEDQKLLSCFCSHLMNLFQYSKNPIKKSLERRSSFRKKKSSNLNGVLTFDVILSCVILFWPNYTENKGTNGETLSQAIQHELGNFEKSTITALQYQISIFLKYMKLLYISEST